MRITKISLVLVLALFQTTLCSNGKILSSSPKIAVLGAGYVGLVTSAGLADIGNSIICADIDVAKIESLKNGNIPIYEPGLVELIARHVQDGHLEFTTDIAEAVRKADVIFIAVGTPMSEDGSADLSYGLYCGQPYCSKFEWFQSYMHEKHSPNWYWLQDSLNVGRLWSCPRSF